MAARPKRADWTRDLADRQRNVVFPDTVRNAGNFWRGLRGQRLNRPQTVGLLVLIFFYLALITGLIVANWPQGDEPLWRKVLQGFGSQLLISIPFFAFLLISHLVIRRKR